jgi:hypothetical protein
MLLQTYVECKVLRMTSIMGIVHHLEFYENAVFPKLDVCPFSSESKDIHTLWSLLKRDDLNLGSLGKR